MKAAGKLKTASKIKTTSKRKTTPEMKTLPKGRQQQASQFDSEVALFRLPYTAVVYVASLYFITPKIRKMLALFFGTKIISTNPTLANQIKLCFDGLVNISLIDFDTEDQMLVGSTKPQISAGLHHSRIQKLYSYLNVDAI